MKTARFYIDGMYCAACSITIESGLNQTDGILSSNVSSAEDTAIVCYDETKLNMEEVRERISSLGYSAIDQTASAVSEWKKRKADKLFQTVLIAFLLALPLTFAAVPLPVKLALATVVQFYAGRDFYREAFRGIKGKTLNMGFLIALSTTLTYGFSTVSALTGHPERVFFDSAALILVMVLCGRLIEAKVDARSDSVLDQFLSEQGEDFSSVSVGDVLVVREGERVPLDGVVVEGSGCVDESTLTGEAVPQPKSPGDRVLAGTLNTQGVFQMKVTADADHTVLSGVRESITRSFANKSDIQRVTDKVIRWFSPAVIGIATVTLAVWGLLVAPGDWLRAAEVALCVIVVACPCALGIAAPLSISAAISRAAERGVLIKDAHTVEILAGVKTVGFDKTGTLTDGRFTVTGVVLLDVPSEQDLLLDAAVAEKYSKHPLASGILRYAGFGPEEIPSAETVTSVPGKGIVAFRDGHTIVAGNEALIRERGASPDKIGTVRTALLAESSSASDSYVFIMKDGVLEGAVALEDTIRADAADALAALKEQGVCTLPLTGDRKRPARAVCDVVGIDDCRFGLLPEEKQAALSALPKNTAMVGDGLNDAPTLAAADVGFALGTGTALTEETADVVILDSALSKVPGCIALGKQTLRNIYQNLGLSCVYNLVAMGFAVSGALTPVVAAAAMSLSSLSVVLNAHRVRRMK